MPKSYQGRGFHRTLTFWVLVGLLAGSLLGLVAPEFAVRMRFLADTFISVMTLLIAPVIFTTVVGGIAAIGGRGGLGGLSLRALFYFEAATTLALVIGLLVGNALALLPVPHGADAHIDRGVVAPLEREAAGLGGVTNLDWIIPHSFMSAFTSGNALQVLFLAVLFGAALVMSGQRGAPVLDLVDRLGHIMFCMVRIVVTAAPAATFGGAAFTVGRFGFVPMRGLLSFVLAFYLTCGAVIVGGLGLVARANGFSLLRLLRYLRHELLVVVGTSSSEPVYPRVLRKLELAGVPRATGAPLLAGGYSLHLLGTCVYLTMAAMYVATATGGGLSVSHQLLFLAVAVLTSKSAVGVTGSGLLTLVATLSVTHSVPLAGVALVVGIDRIMSEARAVTNFIGNTVAALVITNWLGRLDSARLNEALAAERPPDPSYPEDDPKVVDIRISD
ncbi:MULTISPECIES: cation:dicarboxylate symporter family transporter [Streptomyces]|uniref:cation:dicarboxylate symporter family transporter n=1 Tax=Streptomyces TaxID=1883 RepID=UPI0029310B4C|nr:cation:dicarboxylase symporter family transporter [Streptomyces sp. NEAU-HV9]